MVHKNSIINCVRICIRYLSETHLFEPLKNSFKTVITRTRSAGVPSIVRRLRMAISGLSRESFSPRIFLPVPTNRRAWTRSLVYRIPLGVLVADAEATSLRTMEVTVGEAAVRAIPRIVASSRHRSVDSFGLRIPFVLASTIAAFATAAQTIDAGTVLTIVSRAHSVLLVNVASDAPEISDTMPRRERTRQLVVPISIVADRKPRTRLPHTRATSLPAARPADGEAAR